MHKSNLFFLGWAAIISCRNCAHQDIAWICVPFILVHWHFFGFSYASNGITSCTLAISTHCWQTLEILDTANGLHQKLTENSDTLSTEIAKGSKILLWLIVCARHLSTSVSKAQDIWNLITCYFITDCRLFIHFTFGPLAEIAAWLIRLAHIEMGSAATWDVIMENDWLARYAHAKRIIVSPSPLCPSSPEGRLLYSLVNDQYSK